jgi:energy-coupling factor transport system ATP-binding protein
VAGWDPLPVTVREARRRSGDLAARLSTVAPPSPSLITGEVIASVDDLSVTYGGPWVLHSVSLEVRAGSITALMGRNGSGKSTLLGALAGMIPADRGSVSVDRMDPNALKATERISRVGLVPQDPGLLLYCQHVGVECTTADAEHHLAEGTTAAAVERITADLDHDRHPKDLSEGQRLSLALGVVLAAEPLLVLLDEPTRGLDYDAKRALCLELRRLAAEGRAVFLATHDVELVAMVADRAVVLAGGEVIADGFARDVVCHTPAFAPQVAKVLAPQSWLTAAEVATALSGVES